MPSGTAGLNAPFKGIIAAPSGAGKSGSQASLICAGYKLRIVDTDKGIRPLLSLLTHPKYPYGRYISDHKIDLNIALNYVQIDQPMTVKEGEFRPLNARGWNRVADLFTNWKDGDINLGPISSWGDDCVLTLDTFATLAKMAYYNAQSINGRLGARDEGYDYQRDVGAAQNALMRLLETLFSTAISCNVLILSHITWIDESGGVVGSPEQRARAGERPEARGYPSSIGRALGPQMGKFFNDVFTIGLSGSGQSVRRQIRTVPNDGVISKTSTYLQPTYDISTGLAEIFSEVLGRPLPDDFLKRLGRPVPQIKSASEVSAKSP